MRILLILLVFFTIVSFAAGKGKGKGGPKPPAATEPPIITIVEEDGPWCYWCLRNNGGRQCIPICELDPTGWECRNCIADNAPICLRVCGFPWLQDRMLEMVNPSPPDPCVTLPFTGLPLKIGSQSTVSSVMKDVDTAEMCGLLCMEAYPEHQGWTWANHLEPNPEKKFNCWCLSIVGVPFADITRDSSVTPGCPEIA